MVDIKGVTKTFRKNGKEYIALENVSVIIEKGDYLVITGASGAGKSTLLNSIGGLIRPDSGKVLYNGLDIYEQDRNITDKYRKKHVGFMFQQFHLMPYLNILDNISLACYEDTHYGNIKAYLNDCSLSGLEKKYPSELSVGEKQRVAFIRAIITCPDILLADEPTGNLDPENSKILLLLVEEFRKKGGTVILVSHYPVADKYASRRISMQKGRIVD